MHLCPQGGDLQLGSQPTAHPLPTSLVPGSLPQSVVSLPNLVCPVFPDASAWPPPAHHCLPPHLLGSSFPKCSRCRLSLPLHPCSAGLCTPVVLHTNPHPLGPTPLQVILQNTRLPVPSIYRVMCERLCLECCKFHRVPRCCLIPFSIVHPLPPPSPPSPTVLALLGRDVLLLPLWLFLLLFPIHLVTTELRRHLFCADSDGSRGRQLFNCFCTFFTLLLGFAPTSILIIFLSLSLSPIETVS